MSDELSSGARPASTLTPVSISLAILCCLIWAGAYVSGKAAIGTPDAPGLGPFRTAFLRFAIGGALLAFWGWWRDPGSMRIARADWPALGRLALLGLGLTYAFNYAGLSLSTSTAAALIVPTEPIWIALLATIFLRERLTPPRLFGIACGVVGTFLVVLSAQKPDATAPAAHGFGGVMLGSLLMVLSLLWESIGILTAKRLTARYRGRAILAYEFLFGALFLAPLAVWEARRDGITTPSPVTWAAFAYLLLACTLVAYPLWFRLLETTDASELTLFLFLQPVVGTLIGVAWKGDPFTPVTLLGSLFVLAGMVGISRQAAEMPERSPRAAPDG